MDKLKKKRKSFNSQYLGQPGLGCAWNGIWIVHQIRWYIRLLGYLAYDVMCTTSDLRPPPLHPPSPRHKHTHTPPHQHPSSDYGKKSDRWVHWKDPLGRPKHTKALLSVWRLDLEGNGKHEGRTGQSKMDICGVFVLFPLLWDIFLSWMSAEPFGWYSV